MAKHYDNKNNLIAEMRKNKRHTEAAMSATFKAYMLLACCTLKEDFDLPKEDFQKFVDGVFKRVGLYNSGEFDVSDMEKYLMNEAGIYIEGPRFDTSDN